MTANSKIEWTDHTFNPWIGCTKVGPGCDHCYAESQNTRLKGGNWGPGAPRRVTSLKNWQEVHKWNKAAKEAGKPAFVFCASMADVFDNEADYEARNGLWDLMEMTSNLVWIIVTKRGPNVPKMIPDRWKKGKWPVNVWLLYTICNQEEADREVPRLLDQKAKYNIPVVGLSMEPLLEAVSLYKPGEASSELRTWQAQHGIDPDEAAKTGRMVGLFPCVDWVIVGGESGKDARPMHPDWARSLRDQCEAANVHFFFKQWGNCLPFDWMIGDTGPSSTGWIWDYDEANCNVDIDALGLARMVEAHGREFARFSHKNTGNLLDYKTHQARPDAVPPFPA